MNFSYPATPQILHWLAAGQLGNRLHRSVRLWVILTKLYGEENWIEELPRNFTYSQLRDRLFKYNHPKIETLTIPEINAQCTDKTCICHQTAGQIFPITPQWEEEIIKLTGLTSEYLQDLLKQPPFATVHRSLRDDLKQLARLGWLKVPHKGQYQGISKSKLPQLNLTTVTQPSFTQISLGQTWEIIQALESISFIKPNLDIIIQNLWEQMFPTTTTEIDQQPEKRIFVHLDYIISEEKQDQVDNYQEQIEQIWRNPSLGVVRFKMNIPKTGTKAEIIVYPVCIHYSRRAKYLSAYGKDPDGNIGWHNYRLDRIISKKLQILSWGDPAIPPELQQMWYNNQLPTPAQVEAELATAWGFNFYLERELLIMRFPPDFARWYVDNTRRHQSFQPIHYTNIPKLIREHIPKPQQQQILEIIKHKSPSDAYYTAWIRTEDINVLMRLREWRPKGEVIAPLSIREKLKQECLQELSNYE